MAAKIELARTKNCGIGEINGLSCYPESPLDALKALHGVLRHGITWPPFVDHSGERKNKNFPFLLFTGVVPKDLVKYGHQNYGQRFADYITANDLGNVVTVSAPRPNWTGNLIQIWVWEPNYDNLWALLGPAPNPLIPKPVPVGEDNGIDGPEGTREAQPVGHRLTPREADEQGSEDRG